MKVTYSSTNSGGSWWMSDEDWKNLEDAGWDVAWFRDQKDYRDGEKGGRWLGALATEASLECESMIDAIRSWEKVTGQDASEEGCNCCGPPHFFFSDVGDYASGETILDILYIDAPRSLREAAERSGTRRWEDE